MADFLERLTERTLGRLDVVRPDLAPTFAARVVDGHDRLHEPSMAPPGAPWAEPSAGPLDARTRPSPPDALHTTVVDGPAAERPPAPVESSSISEHTFGRIAIEDRSSIAIALSTPAPSAQTPSRRLDRESSLPPRAAVAPPDRSASRERQGSTVSITIGRIDVRAVAATAPAPPVAKARSSGLRTLEHYLAERNGGRA